jgi:hypothetical protein
MTIRTQAELEALYADNTVGDISAADLRDFVSTFFQPRTLYIQATLQAATTGPGKPVPMSVGPTSYHEFSVADEYWPHVTLPSELDVTQDILIHVDWAADAAEASRTVSWQLDYLLMGSVTKDIDTIEGTLTVVDAAVPATQYTDETSLFTIPASAVAQGDHEVKLKLTRLASTNDPVLINVHHIWAEVITKPPGAS